MLSHLVETSLTQQHQPERKLTMARISASAVMADTVNEIAKRYALLVEMLMNNIRFAFRTRFIIFVYVCIVVIEVC